MCAPKPPWATERGEEVKLQKTIVVYKKTHITNIMIYLKYFLRYFLLVAG
jgi:hypothetical protein